MLEQKRITEVMMKKSAKFLVAVLCVAIGLFAFAACGGETDNSIPPVAEGKVRVTFYDGTTMLSYQDIDKNGQVTKPATDPTKSGYDFVRWYATPSYNIAYDFNKKVTENIGVYAGFRAIATIDETYYLAGDSKSDLFNGGSWKGDYTAANVPAGIKLVKSADKGNEFSITLNMYKSDKFQILPASKGWGGQIGHGYMSPEQRTSDVNNAFYGQATPYSDGSKTSNIVCGKSGNYTLTLKVDKDNKLTEFSYTYNGAAAALGATYNFYMQGEQLNDWNTKALDYTKFTTTDNINYELTIGMKKGDMFLLNGISSTNKQGQWGPEGGDAVLAADAKTTAAVDIVANKNFRIKDDTAAADANKTGTYKFKLKLENEVLTVSAEKLNDTLPTYDYYVKVGDNAEQAMTLVTNDLYPYAQVESLTLAQNDKFVILAKQNGTLKYTINADYAYGRLVSPKIKLDESDKKFAVKTADTFTVRIHPHSMYVTVKGNTDTAIVYGVYAKGKMNDWGKIEKKQDTDKIITADHKVAFTGEYTNNEMTKELSLVLNVGDDFMFISYNTADEKYGQVHYANGYFVTGDAIKSTTNANGGLEGVQNLKCLVAGTYKFTITINKYGRLKSIAATKTA